LSINKTTWEINFLVADVLAAHQSTLRKKRIDTRVHLQTKHQVLADENMLRTVLRNLISNAIKFTPSGGKIHIFVDEYTQDAKPPMIITRIKDTGVGIRKEDLENLFDLNRNFRTDGTDKEPGTGLGLILCKDFIEKNSGSLMVESKVGEGSSFSFTLPRA
jgi:signal transduction histidine kinase